MIKVGKLVVIFIVVSWLIQIAGADTIKITASDGSAGDRFGTGLSIDGDYAIVGAHCDNEDAGSAYVYHYDGSGWNEESKLIASDSAAGDAFGLQCEISGNRAIFGAQTHDGIGTDSGAAYVWYRDSVNGWIEQSKLTASDGTARDNFGADVSVYNDWAVVGAPGYDNSSSGSAYIFHYEGSNWVENRKLSVGSSDLDLRFGQTVCVKGDWVFVGAGHDDDMGTDAGAVYMYSLSNPGWSQKLTASDGNAGDGFGREVDIDGDYAVIGSYYAGSAYVFKYDGSSWVEEEKLAGPYETGSSHPTTSACIDGDNIIIGHEWDDTMAMDAGAAHLFHRNGSDWNYTSSIFASDPAQNDRFGISVDISNNYALLGADLKNGWTGAAYIVSIPEPCTLSLLVLGGAAMLRRRKK